jgi:hypothetical protein
VELELRAREMEEERRRKKEEEEYRKNVSVRAKVGHTYRVYIKGSSGGRFIFSQINSNLILLEPFPDPNFQTQSLIFFLQKKWKFSLTVVNAAVRLMMVRHIYKFHQIIFYTRQEVKTKCGDQKFSTSHRKRSQSERRR